MRYPSSQFDDDDMISFKSLDTNMFPLVIKATLMRISFLVIDWEKQQEL